MVGVAGFEPTHTGIKSQGLKNHLSTLQKQKTRDFLGLGFSLVLIFLSYENLNIPLNHNNGRDKLEMLLHICSHVDSLL